jgi:hypothetical protein
MLDVFRVSVFGSISKLITVAQPMRIEETLTLLPLLCCASSA